MREKLTKRNEQTGFTIIEVVLVLAIAGLIFLIVFLALPQLQRSRRDTQRKSDVGRIMAALESFASNNSGKYPGNGAAGATVAATDSQVRNGFNNFSNSFLNDGSFIDPSSGFPYGHTTAPATGVVSPITSLGNAYKFDSGDSTTSPPRTGVFKYVTNASCSGESLAYSQGDGKIAVIMKLETGAYCQDNS